MTRQGRDRILLAVLVLAAVVGMAVSYGISRDRDWRRYEETFDARSAELAESLSKELESYALAITSVRSFIEGSEKVTDAEFAIFAGALIRNKPELISIDYILAMNSGQRLVWELANGLSVSDLDESGRLKKAPLRPGYMVLELGFPEDVSATFKGLDISAFPKIKDALEETASSGAEVALCDVAIIDPSGDNSRGCIIAVPVQQIQDRLKSGENAPPEGFLLAALDTEMVLAKLARSSEESGMLVKVESMDGEEAHLIMDFAGEPLRRRCLLLPDYPRNEVTVEKLGLSLKASFAATPMFQRDNLSYMYLVTFPVGLLLTAVGVLAILLVGKEKLQLVNMVEQRVTELRSSEARYKEMFLSSYDPILLIDSQGLIEMANPACAALTGKASGGLAGMRFEELLSPEAKLAGIDLVQRVTEGTALRFEHRVVNASGGMTEVDGTYSSLPEGKIQAIWRILPSDRRDQ